MAILIVRYGSWDEVDIPGVLFVHAPDRAQNLTEFFTELCATGSPNPPARSIYSIENKRAPYLRTRLLTEGLQDPR
jgi:hypothetical protein